MAALTLVVAGCSGADAPSDVGASCANPAPEVVTERPVGITYRGPHLGSDQLLKSPKPNLVVQLTSTEPSIERVRLTLDGEDALDVDLPRALGCGNGEAVYSVGYALPAGSVAVGLDLQGETTTTTIEVPAEGTLWAVIQVQSRREWGEIELYDAEPGWA